MSAAKPQRKASTAADGSFRQDLDQSRIALLDISNGVLPRILTQVCRDPSSPMHGCCDRNWWHYKIRDFPSVILQQAGHTIATASIIQCESASSKELASLAAATARFWNARALRYGAFEEYYPYEQGYPPLAFSTLAVAHLCAAGIAPLSTIKEGLTRAVRQLLSRFEPHAANQQVAGTAALAIARRIAPELVPESAFSRALDRTLALQTPEGWFPEYDGPDLGYLSVTMDCLWDIHDATGDVRAHEAVARAFDFLAWFVLDTIGSAGMHNSRNTDYIVPYGIARLALSAGAAGAAAANVLRRLYDPSSATRCRFDAVDDRYWCHYIGASVFRAAVALGNQRACEVSQTPLMDSVLRTSFGLSGHVWSPAATPSSPAVMVSTRKGAIATILWPNGRTSSDFGWIVKSRGQAYVSHWWTPQWEVRTGPDEIGCDGWLVPATDHLSSPWKHVILRVASFALGPRLIPLLKRILIFRRSTRAYAFRRRIAVYVDRVVIEDSITGIQPNDEILRAPRSSKRHVASADTFHTEDFALAQRPRLTEVVEHSSPQWRSVTTYWGAE